ncbi:MAG: pseudouridine synthase, partial [Alphaproteobacteria bacterium]|nr:pseudouridine synthase [Alphaproteobacteria bacterium]
AGGEIDVLLCRHGQGFHRDVKAVARAFGEAGQQRRAFEHDPQRPRRKGLPRVVSVGRLDLNTEGLLLLTNDGALSRHLELPSTGWKRRYRVRVHGTVKQADLDSLKKGITIDGIKYGPVEAILERAQSASNTWLTVILREGKNREIRKIMEHFDLKVSRLIRLAYGPFLLGDLPEGAAKEVPHKVMREQIADFFKS